MDSEVYSNGSGHGPVRFGVFELDRRASELRKHGIRIKLQKKPMCILEMLLDRAGDVVTREDLRQALWPPGVYVDFDHSLNSAVNKLRDALADSAANPRFIETLTQGYRFIASVTANGAISRELSSGGIPAGPVPVAPAGQSEIPARHAPRFSMLRTLFSWPRIGFAALSLALLILALLGVIRAFERRGPPADRSLVIAVLPFQNLSGDQQQEFFSDGFTEEMIAQLGRIAPRRLQVIARASTMPYKQTVKGIDRIGAELGADYILQGSVRRSELRVRITAAFIRVGNQAQIWVRSYDRDLREILSLQADVAQAIASEIQMAFDPVAIGSRAHLPASPEVHEAYLRGRYFLDKRPDGLDKSIQSFEEAVRLDPNYAPAYAGLADAYGALGWGIALGDASPEIAYPKALAAATKALELDPNSSETLVARARILWKYEWKWQAAEDAFRRAIELDPASAAAHESYFDCLWAMKRDEDAYSELTKAAALDPVSLTINHDFGLHFERAGEYDKAVARFSRAIDLDPASGFVHHELGEMYALRGMYTEAVAELNRAIQLSGRLPHFVAVLGAVRARMGDRRASLDALESLKASGRYVSGNDFAILYASLGKTDQALAALNESYRNHDVWLSINMVQFGLEPVRTTLKYQELLTSLGLVKPASTAQVGPFKR
jgi:TolB-like protein/DNA-binding winged helix-turn-helix (wHTH) protein/Tfp pilus assembly protein PilF